MKTGIQNWWSQGMVGVPTVFVAGSWLAIWLLWPRMDAPESIVRILRPQSVSYVRLQGVTAYPYTNPDLIGRPSSVSFRDPEDRRRMPDIVGIAWVNRQKLLELAAGTEVGPADDVGGRSREIERAGEWRVRWPEVRVYGGPGGDDMRLVVGLAPALRECEFTMQELPLDQLQPAATAWQVVAYVTGDASGETQHVFLESPSENAEVNALVVKTVMKGRALKTGKTFAGRVNVSYGRP